MRENADNILGFVNFNGSARHMNDQEKILTAILQNAEMGTTAIRSIFPQVRDPALKNELRRQLSEYSRRSNTVNRQMHNLRISGKSITPMAKVMTVAGIKMKTVADNSTENIAKMLVQGTNMGIIDLNHALNSAADASTQLTGQARELLAKEQHYLDRLKAYL